ncbi:MAG TPA: division/cell wall cluster transcriptional repressor MraZ [Anaerolineales bacterium]|nr:division/cell wall cluster transcriptional repressor MraZ [Anaerolineales bacterium]
MFFLGQYRHNIDDKGRLTVPARFRELLSEGAYITQGFDRNLMVLAAPDFEAMVRKLRSSSSLTNSDDRDLKRLLFSTADKVQPDGNGRILLPQFLRDQHQLDGEVVLVGVGDYFEIWSPENWDQRMGLLQDADANANRFAALDLSTFQE